MESPHTFANFESLHTLQLSGCEFIEPYEIESLLLAFARAAPVKKLSIHEGHFHLGEIAVAFPQLQYLDILIDFPWYEDTVCSMPWFFHGTTVEKVDVHILPPDDEHWEHRRKPYQSAYGGYTRWTQSSPPGVLLCREYEFMKDARLSHVMLHCDVHLQPADEFQCDAFTIKRLRD